MERLRSGRVEGDEASKKTPGRAWQAMTELAVMKGAIQQHVEKMGSGNTDTVVDGAVAGAVFAAGLALLAYIGTRDEENPFDGRDLPEALTAAAIFGAGLGATIDWSLKG